MTARETEALEFLTTILFWLIVAIGTLINLIN
jgi:hypothetical protein